MIAVDTSALMAMVLDEPGADACGVIVAGQPGFVMSAVTLAEAMIVSQRRNLAEEMSQLLREVAPRILPADAGTARRVAAAYSRWGKGVHPARLNLVDCFSYDSAQANGRALLYVGRDFAQTDIASAFPAAL